MEAPLSAKRGPTWHHPLVYAKKYPNFPGDRFALHVTRLRTLKEDFQHERPLQYQHFRL